MDDFSRLVRDRAAQKVRHKTFKFPHSTHRAINESAQLMNYLLQTPKPSRSQQLSHFSFCLVFFFFVGAYLLTTARPLA